MLLVDTENRLVDQAAGMWYCPEAGAWMPLEPGTSVTGRSLDLLDAVRWRQQKSGSPCRVPVAVIGGRKAEPYQLEAAEAMGRLIGSMGLTLICGGREGIMEAACRGASMAGGISVGILPDADASMANAYVTIPVATGIGIARNALVARSALCLVAVGGGYGTISEIAFGLQFEKRVFGLADPPQVPGMTACRTPGEAAEGVARAVLGLSL